MSQRLLSKAQAEQEWTKAIADTVTYPLIGRDYGGPGECGATLQCTNPVCAGGKLQIAVATRSYASAQKIKRDQQIVETGAKRKNKPKDLPFCTAPLQARLKL